MDLTVDLKKMRIADLAAMSKGQRGFLPPDELVPILDRVIVGGAGHLPLETLPAVVDAVTSEIQDLLDYTWRCEEEPSLIFDGEIGQFPVTEAPRIVAAASILKRLAKAQRPKRRRRRRKRG